MSFDTQSGSDFVLSLENFRGTRTIEYSPDGQLLATGTNDGTVVFWNTRTGEPAQKLTAAYTVLSLSFSPSGQQLAAICTSPQTSVAQVFLWDIDLSSFEGKEGVKTPYRSVLGDMRNSHLVKFSSNGQLIAVMTPILVVLQDVKTGKQAINVVRMNREAQLEPVLSFASGDRKLIYAWCKDPRDKSAPLHVVSFDLESRQRVELNVSIPRSSGLDAPVTCSPAGDVVAAAVSEGGIKTWSLESGDVLQGPLLGHLANTTSVCFSSDGMWVADGSESKTVCVWNASTGEMVAGPLGHSSQRMIQSVACSPLNNQVACIDDQDNVHVWDTHANEVVLSSVPEVSESEHPLFSASGSVAAIHWFPNGRRIVTSGQEDDYVRRWDAQTGEQTREFLFTGGSYAALSPDGALLAVGSSRKLGTVVLMNAKSGREYPPALMGAGSRTRKLEFSPDSAVLAVLLHKSDGLNLHLVYNLRRDRKVELIQSKGNILDVAFSPDGEHFAYAGQREIVICNIRSREATISLATRASKSHAPLSFSPDGQRLVDQRPTGLTLWDIASSKKLLDIDAVDTSSSMTMIMFSPDGRTIVRDQMAPEGEGSVEALDANSGERLWRMEEPSIVTALAFSPGADRIAVGSFDGSLKVRDAASGRVIPLEDPAAQQSSSEEEASVEAENQEQETRADPSRRAIGPADVDDDSIMNMPAVLRSTIVRHAELARKRPSTERKHADKHKAVDSTPRSGLVARFTSRLRRNQPPPSRDGEHRRGLHRAMELVSVARGKNRNAAGGDAGTSRGNRRDGLEGDESSTSSGDSPADADHADSSRAVADEERSSTPSDHGFKDTVLFCLCIPRCGQTRESEEAEGPDQR